MPSISGQVVVDDVVVGSVSGSYVDDVADSSSEKINDVSIPVSVVIDSASVGNGSLTYRDYVSYDGGGSRNVSISGNVLADSVVVGSVSGSLIDRYGRVVAQGVTQPSVGGAGLAGFLVILGLILIIFLVLLSRRRSIG